MLRLRYRAVQLERADVNFGDVTYTADGTVDACWSLESPRQVQTTTGAAWVQDGRLYMRRDDPKRLGHKDKVKLPEGDFTVVGPVQQDQNHPMNDHDFGVVRYHITNGG
ncbi:hypothetical protein ORI20_14055 [Mycobacterium sp. CVI_P3]|uniref:Head-to-tail stopper n=1 Tax=Mycobacterium pinniadriaticum TaxID=2994102 RepID=A0ABT3SFB9_9MYCO|nr:hypothetical protein [Mycobacterium pinniadriaticum]MCX2931404.1 hypothetical protein [Mycobacterium pinniadriaticum]MCX2937828.1 hypothetical protein [Mycobacterium pinniadriaticum]